MHLNWLAVLVTTVAGFAVGAVWYSALFGGIWRTEMKITDEQMKEAAAKGMANFLIKGFIFTLLSTIGLAVLLRAHGTANWKHGAACGLFIGLFTVGMRMFNGAVYEKKSVKLQVINVGHEVVMYTLQGALLGAWH
jgi:hypothetical protein